MAHHHDSAVDDVYDGGGLEQDGCAGYDFREHADGYADHAVAAHL